MMYLQRPRYPKEFIDSYVNHMMDKHINNFYDSSISEPLQNKYQSELQSLFHSNGKKLIKNLIKENYLNKDYYSKIKSLNFEKKDIIKNYLQKNLGIYNKDLISKIKYGKFIKDDYKKEKWFSNFIKDADSLINKRNQDLKEAIEGLSGEKFDTYPSYFRKLILLLPEDMEKYKLYNRNNHRSKYNDIKTLYGLTSEININGNIEKINTYMVKNFFGTPTIGLFVCPYCNRDYVNSRDKCLGCEMDHFYNKDNYPLFAISLFNFIPSCGTCNRIKSNTDLKINPYIKEHHAKHRAVFNIIRSKENSYLISLRQLNEQGEVVNIDDEINNDLHVCLKLDKAYQIHSADIEEMVRREQEYGADNRNFLKGMFTANLNKEEINEKIDRLIYGDVIHYDEADLINISLGKLKTDVYKKIKSWTK